MFPTYLSKISQPLQVEHFLQVKIANKIEIAANSEEICSIADSDSYPDDSGSAAHPP